MKKLLKKIITGILIASMFLAALTLMTGCGGGGLIGTWEHSSGQTMEFSRNGNVTFRYSGESTTFTWEVNEGRLTIMAPDGVVISGPYEIVGSTLTVFDGGFGQSWTRR